MVWTYWEADRGTFTALNNGGKNAQMQTEEDIKPQLQFGASKTAIAMAQLLQYNCHARIKKAAACHRHSKD